MVGGGDPSTLNFGSTGPHWSEIADFQPIFARKASSVTAIEKSSINTNRKSTTRFPKSLRSYVAPKSSIGRAQKRKTAVFCLKSHFAWRKSATKFLCVKTVSDKVVKHSLAYQCKKMNGRRCSLLHENFAHTNPQALQTPIFDLFSSVAPQSLHEAKKFS